MNLENTYLRHAIVNSEEHVIRLIRNVYNDIYDDAVAVYTDTNTIEKRHRVRKLVRERSITTYREWHREVLGCLVKFLNAYFAPSEAPVNFGYEPITGNTDKYFLECFAHMLPYEEDALLADPELIEEALENDLPVPKFSTNEVKQIDLGAIDELIEFFEKMDGVQREALGRPSHHELITFNLDKGTGWIVVSYWGDNRIHLYNELIANKDNGVTTIGNLAINEDTGGIE